MVSLYGLEGLGLRVGAFMHLLRMIYYRIYGGFLKLGGTILGVPIIRTIVYWGLYWGPPILGNYHMYTWELKVVPGV